MNKYRRIAGLCIALEVLLLIAGAMYINKSYERRNVKEYKVEISRLKQKMEEGEAVQELDLAKCSYVVSVKPFKAEDRCRYDYAVEEVRGELYRFEYKKAGMESVLRIFYGLNGMVILITMGIFLYLDRNIINPFKRMNYLTTELARGNLAVPMKQERSKYFKHFLWGMDMLREKLESDRVRELELLKEKKLLILSLSHDIKTPLFAIDLYTKALVFNLYESEEEKSAAIQGIEKNVSEIKRYVEEIAQASREEFLSFEVHNSEVYLADILKEINQYYDDKCRRLHISLEVGRVDNCLVLGDKDRIVEVMQNLMENAMKYGDGKVIKISFTEEESCKLITVSNTGCTLKEEELPHVFDSFFRGSNSEKQKGSGLGLYISRELMHKMDGDIFARLQNSEFEVTIVLRKIS